MVHKLISAELPRHDHSFIACSRHIYVWCCSSRTSRSWWITQSTQHHRIGCKTRKWQLNWVPGYDPYEYWNDDHVSRQACAVQSTWKAYLLLKRQFKNKKQIKDVCYVFTPILGSSACYREKRSHNCMVDSFWASKHIALQYIWRNQPR